MGEGRERKRERKYEISGPETDCSHSQEPLTPVSHSVIGGDSRQSPALPTSWYCTCHLLTRHISLTFLLFSLKGTLPPHPPLLIWEMPPANSVPHAPGAFCTPPPGGLGALYLSLSGTRLLRNRFVFASLRAVGAVFSIPAFLLHLGGGAWPMAAQGFPALKTVPPSALVCVTNLQHCIRITRCQMQKNSMLQLYTCDVQSLFCPGLEDCYSL